MSEMYSIREIAKRLVEEYNAKNQRDCRLPAAQDLVPIFDGLDRELLRKMGIEE